jgi:hypothetical protein
MGKGLRHNAKDDKEKNGKVREKGEFPEGYPPSWEQLKKFCFIYPRQEKQLWITPGIGGI